MSSQPPGNPSGQGQGGYPPPGYGGHPPHPGQPGYGNPPGYAQPQPGYPPLQPGYPQSQPVYPYPQPGYPAQPGAGQPNQTYGGYPPPGYGQTGYGPPPGQASGQFSGGQEWMLERELAGTRPWLLVIGIVMIVFGALGLLGMFINAGAGIMGGAELFGVLIFFVLYFAAATLLLRYANSIQGYRRFRTPYHFEGALNAQLSFWRFVGIASIVIISLYIVVVIAAVANAA